MALDCNPYITRVTVTSYKGSSLTCNLLEANKKGVETSKLKRDIVEKAKGSETGMHI